MFTFAARCLLGGRTEPLGCVEHAAGQRPRPRERRFRAPPEQHLQLLLADLEHNAERLVAEAIGRHTVIVTATAA